MVGYSSLTAYNRYVTERTSFYQSARSDCSCYENAAFALKINKRNVRPSKQHSANTIGIQVLSHTSELSTAVDFVHAIYAPTHTNTHTHKVTPQ
jgi:hypothetical protein